MWDATNHLAAYSGNKQMVLLSTSEQYGLLLQRCDFNHSLTCIYHCFMLFPSFQGVVCFLMLYHTESPFHSGQAAPRIPHAERFAQCRIVKLHDCGKAQLCQHEQGPCSSAFPFFNLRLLLAPREPAVALCSR